MKARDSGRSRMRSRPAQDGIAHMSVRRVHFSSDADTRIRMLKARTGITPNLLCRMGFCLSLQEPGVPKAENYPDGPREINRYTLLGEYDELFVALLRQRLASDGLPATAIDDQFKAHMNRGVILLAGRLRDLGALGALVGATPSRPRTASPSGRTRPARR